MIEKSSPMERPVTIGICTSALRSNIEALIAKVASLPHVTVRFIQLPYNDLDNFRLSSKGLDGVIICHSINNRRFAITDVLDALYDVFLPHVRRVFGKGSVCVIAHDFKWPMGRAGSSSGDHARIKYTQMDNFRFKQPTTFTCSNLATICGRLDNRVDMDEEDWTQLKVFVRQCRVRSEISRIPAAIRRVYEPIENDSPLHNSNKFLRCFLMFVCLPVMFILMALECSWSLTMLTWLKDASHSLCTSFKQNVIDKTLEFYQSYRVRSGVCYSMLCCIPCCCSCCCCFIFTLVSKVCWSVRQCRVRSEISRIPAAVRRVYEPIENDSPLPHSHKFVRYILMLVCLPVMLILMALECRWSLTMLTWLKDASHSLCTSFKQNVIDKTLESYQSYRVRSGICYSMLCCITCCCCCFIFTLVSKVCWSVRQCRVLSEISRILAAVRRVYEPIENDSPLPHSHKFLRYILMLVCLPVMLILVALECSWSLMMCLKDASHSLCTSFKQNVIDKTLESYQSYRVRSGICYSMLCCIPCCCSSCCCFIFTLVSKVCCSVCKCLGYRRREAHFARMQTPDVLRS